MLVMRINGSATYAGHEIMKDKEAKGASLQWAGFVVQSWAGYDVSSFPDALGPYNNGLYLKVKIPH